MAEAALNPLTRSLVTPEGVDLHVRLASVSERAVALIIDLAIILGTLIVLTIAFAAAFRHVEGNVGAEIAQIIWLLGFFLLRNFYFTLFESSARAATPGKRFLGLRVASRNGGALSADAVVARNAMRELELYLPLVFLFSRGQDIDAVIILAGTAWCLIFVLLPLFNRDKLRAGDMIGGTWVLHTPKQKLMPDLAGEKIAEADGYLFAEAQLDAYGVKELQVLEQVLRISETQAMAAVAERIRAKINWRRIPHETDFAFLSAYYAGLRRRLEQRLLFGKRKVDKFDQT